MVDGSFLLKFFLKTCAWWACSPYEIFFFLTGKKLFMAHRLTAENDLITEKAQLSWARWGAYLCLSGPYVGHPCPILPGLELLDGPQHPYVLSNLRLYFLICCLHKHGWWQAEMGPSLLRHHAYRAHYQRQMLLYAPLKVKARESMKY